MSRGIFPASFAEMLKARAGEKYQPSNGTEGDFHVRLVRALRPRQIHERG